MALRKRFKLCLTQLLLMAIAAIGTATSATPGFIHPGTPKGVPSSFDCAVRTFAWNYGKQLLPRRGDFRTLFDALQLQACGLTPPSTTDQWIPPQFPTPANALFVDPVNGDDSNPGTITEPFRTLAHAVDAARGTTNQTIALRAGRHFANMIAIGADHSGLTIQNYNGEHAIVTGAMPLNLTKDSWKPHEIVPPHWVSYSNQNNVYGQAISHNDTTTIKYLGTFNTSDECQQAATNSSKGPFYSWTHHLPAFGGDYAGQCFGINVDTWSPTPEKEINSGRLVSRNTWVADLSGVAISNMTGLRINDQRAIRAKYPNGHPELSGNWFITDDPAMGNGQYVEGWVTAPTQWVHPAPSPPATDVISNATDWPGVIWPMSQEGGSTWTGEGDWGDFHIGMGGSCINVDPPIGYWCSNDPPRGIITHTSPDGVFVNNITLPNLDSYSDPSGAIIQAWRGGGRWYTNQCIVKSFNGTALLFDKDHGCNQGGEGEVDGSQWWIENVKEECDSANEFFFDSKTKKLYFNFNTTEPLGTEQFAATVAQILFNISGTMQNPVRNITIRGLELRDAALTYVGDTEAAKHGLPSGGDWALQRSGAITVTGTESFMLNDSLITRVDGNGVFLGDYNRGANILNNEMNFIGDTAIASWGLTGTCLDSNCTRSIPYKVGPDGRGGHQPRGTTVKGNLVREVGIWQKQSSFWFQAITAQTHLAGNVLFNGPRAGLNFNDGFGGGDLIEDNLLFNCVRESGDHGPWNSWDRVPYITDIGMVPNASAPLGHSPANGKPSIIPTFREIRHNFVIGYYASQETIDTDDGSSYYLTHGNFFVYGSNGLKSDFGGQWNHHFGNVYGYVGNCFGTGNNLAFYNNTCVSLSESGYHSTCKLPSTMTVGNNSVSYQTGDMDACGTKLSKWIAEGHDPGTTIGPWPSDISLIDMAKAVLNDAG